MLITISTGGLEAMRPDLEIPEQYGIFHTVGDTAGPGGWSRALRSIPVFARYADEIKALSPNAYVLNYTNPMGALTKVLSDRLRQGRVIGLCHGLFEFHIVMRQIFSLESEKDVEVRFGGLNHFFWMLDFAIGGREGYALLRKKMGRRPLYELMDAIPREIGGWTPGNRLASELFDNYGYLPYTADRHICEFFSCYTTNKELMERFGLERTTIADRESYYARLRNQLSRFTSGEETLSNTPSREAAADIIAAVTLDRGFTDVVNMVNVGQIANLPQRAVVETMGYVDAGGASALAVGALPEPIRALCEPHARVQIRTVEAALSGDLDGALMALAADPCCAHMTVSDIKKMGRELMDANRQLLPQFSE